MGEREGDGGKGRWGIVSTSEQPFNPRSRIPINIFKTFLIRRTLLLKVLLGSS